ncbi:RNA-binding protein [Plectosphaerella cucumerina]|uniref:RNA-binding protein n=1 Tax=Plectosphaerella cucumerina TaxID=40658 RepID=A0A8K0TES1_9PEZI|nr:RNA-binding protein [Plectosphaerella cucumerina]
MSGDGYQPSPRDFRDARDDRSWNDAASRHQPHGYYDDHRSRQGKDPNRAQAGGGSRDTKTETASADLGHELSYDDVPEQEEAAQYGRGRSGGGYPDREYDDGYRGRGYGRGDDWDRGDYHRSRREDDEDGYTGERDRRGRSRSPRRNAGTPSDTIILEALPTDITQEEVRASLQRCPAMSDYPSFEVRVPPGRGRRAFVQFPSLEDAMSFVDTNYPKLLLDFEGRGGEDADGMTNVYIHFARAREEPDARGSTGQNWTCSVCEYSNYGTRSRCKSCGGPQSDALSYRHLLTGESDAADTPSQILVFYPLAPSVTEDVLAVGAAKLELVEKPAAARHAGDGPKLKSTAPTGDTTGFGARPGSLHRVFLMRDRYTNESFNFGFAEFWTVNDALAAITKFKKFREFTIASAAVAVSTIHLGVFVPELRELHPGIEALSFNPLFNPTLRVKYWDPHVLPSQKVVNEQPPEGTKIEEDGDDSADAKKTKKRKADGSLAAGASKKSAVPMAGQMAFWQKRHVELHDGKASKQQDGAEASERAPAKVSMSLSGNNQGPIKIALSSGAKAISTGASVTPPAGTAQGGTPDPTAQAPSKATPISYGDKEKVCCLLCMMKYKSLEDLATHERSRNHKTAAEDEEKVKKANERLAKRGIKIPTEEAPQQEGDEEGGPQYRDRAKERREVYGPSKRPPNQDSSRKDGKGGAPPKAREPSPPPAAPAPSKGLAMLAKMGWSTGKGLGANGEGRTEVVETNAYQEGVGLGAEGGKLGDAAELAAKRTTGGYAEYLSSAQDKARERYNRMG